MAPQKHMLPRFFPVQLALRGEKVHNLQETVIKQLASIRCHNGAKIALAVGSRGISNIAEIVRSTVQLLRNQGAQPFLVPAMGSHGGGTAESQKKILENYGLSQSAVNAPILSQTDTHQVMEFDDGLAVEMDLAAWNSDGVIIINRVKNHTDFHGSIGSGIQKMLAIGLGKMKSASLYHRIGREKGLENIILQAADCLIKTDKVMGAIAIIENSVHETAKIEWIPTNRIQCREPELLRVANDWAPRLPFDRFHGLIVDEIGKDISGTGMDANVVGRRSVGGYLEKVPGCPIIDAIYLRSLSEKSGGNGCGTGIADLGHHRLYEQVNPVLSRINAMTGLNPAIVRMPILFDHDRQALEHMPIILTCPNTQSQKTCWIKNTQSLDVMFLSEPLLRECQEREDMAILDTPQPLEFDDKGELINRWSDYV